MKGVYSKGLSLAARVKNLSRRSIDILTKTWVQFEAIWENVDRIHKILVAIAALITAVALILAVIFRPISPVDCLADNLEFDQLQNCVFSAASEPMEKAFRENQIGRRLTFKARFGSDASAPDRGNLFYALGGWGPVVLNAQAVIRCRRSYINEKESGQQRQLLKRLKRDDEVIVNGVIEEISRLGIKFHDCVMFELTG